MIAGNVAALVSVQSFNFYRQHCKLEVLFLSTSSLARRTLILVKTTRCETEPGVGSLEAFAEYGAKQAKITGGV